MQGVLVKIVWIHDQIIDDWMIHAQTQGLFSLEGIIFSDRML